MKASSAPILALLLMAAAQSSAQQSKPGAPQDLSAIVWHADKVTLTMRAVPPPPADIASAMISRIEIQKTGQTQNVVEHYSNGSQREWWATRDFTASTAYAFGSGETVIAEEIGEADEDHEFSFLSLATVPGLRWLRRAHDAGFAVLDGRRFKHFISAATMEDSKMPRGELWMDEENKQPVRLRVDNTTFEVEYGPPPQAALQVPEKFTQPFFELLQRKQRLEVIQNSGRR